MDSKNYKKMKNGYIAIGKIKSNNTNYHLFKIFPNTKKCVLEVGDYVVGVIENIPITAFYTGGNQKLLTSYNIITSVNN